MRIVLLASALIFFSSCCLSYSQQPQEEIDFVRDIRPILSDRCFACHGPDSGTREADLRLDLHEEALGVITPGKPDLSDLLLRIISDDEEKVMPPPDSKLSVSAKERQLLAAWIKSGAKWKKHWAFEQITQPARPKVRSEHRVSNAIDSFLLAALESKQLGFSPIASKERLIRRATFDLTGLPPTLAEIDAFLADNSSHAFETVVDRLLKSKHYGQRMASDWLDVARYSDTYGYQVDRDRFVWPWRDWVIQSFNANMRYDQFIIEQLAGDLLPNASDDQILATTFNRLHPQKVEGGTVPEEFRVEYVADRMQTFATAFLGLTMDCARCHEHKFDPISQEEYYQLFSYFNNIDEAGLYSYFTNSVPTPTLRLLSPEQKKTLSALQAGVESIERKTPKASYDLSELETIRNAFATKGRGPIEVADFSKVGGRNTGTKDQRGNAAVQLTGDDAVGLKTGNFTRYQPFSITLSMNTPDIKDRAVVFHRSRAWTDAGSRGYQLLIEDGKLCASLIHFWPGNAIRVKTKKQIPLNHWIDVAVVYDGSVTARGLSIFIDGQRADTDIIKDNLTKNITGGGGNNIAIGGRFRDRGFTNGQVSLFKVHDRQLSDIEVALTHDEQSFKGLFPAKGKVLRLSEQQNQLLAQHLNLNNSESHASYRTRLKAAREKLCKTLDGATEIMVMRELVEPKPAFVLDRGLYSSRLEQVTAATPAVFPKMDKSLPNNRLGLARWLTNSDHPLTARVAVNHYWQLIFGRGIVRTPEDFGRQGELPTNPELLDWLAADFVSNGWDVQRLLKQMVMSTAYRQSSFASPELLQRDPENELLARAPTYRLAAEMLRDNVLATSGLLVDKIGGAPVRPYELAMSFKPSNPDAGEGLYRRSLHTYWKRTGPAPVMLALDAAKRDVCRVKRERTSSPLQALAMLNGPQFVEAARALSHKLIQQHGELGSEAIGVDMFRTLTGRRPSKKETAVILMLYEDQREHFSANPETAREYLSTGRFGDYRAAGKASAGKVHLPANKHDFHLGVTPTGHEHFRGEFGRASVFAREFNPDEIGQLLALGRDKPAPKQFSAKISNLNPTHGIESVGEAKSNPAGNQVLFKSTSQLTFHEGLTLEAWIKPSKIGSGRIWDKITPGGEDGLLLDLHGGLRFICGGTVVMANRSPTAGEWSHVACTVNMSSGRVLLYLNGEPVGEKARSSSTSTENLSVLAAWSSVANTLINHDECVTKR